MNNLLEKEKNMDLFLDTQKWLSAIESENTRRNYFNHINDFCEFLFGVPLREVTVEMMLDNNIDFSTMLKYKNFLDKVKQYSGQTIRSKIYGVKSWLEFLYKTKKYNVVEPSQLKLDKKTMPKVKGNNGSKPFTHNEILAMIEKAKEYKNGEMKSLLIEFAYVTAWRKEAIISSLRYGDIYKIKDNANYWLVDIVDKGEKEDTKAISNDLYNRLILLNPNYDDNDLIFPLSNTSVDNLINQLKRDLNIQGDKSFHGIKKSSVNRVLELTNDLLKAQEHACHESIETTAKFYVKYNKDYATSMSLHIMDELDDSIFENMTREELLDLIKHSEDKVKFALSMQIKKEK